jgi:YD repeat-containing protein
VCATAGCATGLKGAGGNSVFVQQVVTGPLNVELLQLRLKSAIVALSQPTELHANASYNRAAEVEHQPNAIYGENRWLGPASGAFEVKAKDTGIGVSQAKYEYHSAEGWQVKKEVHYLGTASCAGVQCAETQHEAFTYASAGFLGLVNGYNTIRYASTDAMPHTWSSEASTEGEAVLKVDTVAPHGIAVSGVTVNGESLELGEVEAHLKVEATDGEGTVPSSGIKSLAIEVDEAQIGAAAGGCPLGPCTASAEWAINGGELGAGIHTLEVVATDAAGNITKKSYTLVVHHASPVAMGPGSVNPESGDFSLGARDVAMSGGPGTLEVTRSYNSRNPNVEPEGPLGPQWSLSLGQLASLEVLPDGSVMVVGPDGLTHFAVKSGGVYEAPEGDSTLKLELLEHGTEYVLKNIENGTTTAFKHYEGVALWKPTVSHGPVATDTVTAMYRVAEVAGKKIVEPTEELAPHPGGSSCEPLGAGCRALLLTYATQRTAGEEESQWGEYTGRLMSVSAKIGTSAAVVVAQYAYDAHGNLRAEWDPRISPNLKTLFGYDSEKHLTALSPPGQQPWLMTYGTTVGDPSMGRLLAVTRPPASAALWNGHTLINTVAPTLSSTEAKQGTALSVSTGSWNSTPQSFAYQWEDCSSTYSGCTPIPGATNPGYTPQLSDGGHTIVAVVTATNASGSPSITSSNGTGLTKTVNYTTQFGVYGTAEGQLSRPTGVALDAAGHLWITDKENHRLSEFSSTGTFMTAVGAGLGSGSLAEPRAVAIDRVSGRIYVADGSANRVQVYSSTGVYVMTLTTGLSTPAGIAVDPSENVWVTNAVTGTLAKFSSAGTYIGSYSREGHHWSGGVAVANNTVYAINQGPLNEHPGTVARLSLSGAYLGEFGIHGSGYGELNASEGLAADPNSGELYVSDPGSKTVDRFTASGSFEGSFGSSGTGAGQFSEVGGMAIDSSGNLYVTNWAFPGVADIQQWKVQPISPEPVPTPPALTANSVSTIEYGVPLEGSGAPEQMGVNAGTHKPEPEKWGQSDDPAEGATAAIFPPDEPMGWPAKEYTRATVYYLDADAREVNVAEPSGGISTTEYNATNNVTRTLSADNRATALVEGGGSIELSSAKSKLLDTTSVYSPDGSELLETRGPQHTVRLSSGSEVLARNHVKYSYDENAPATGETYDLVTKAIDAAEYEGHEADPRETITSYSGQANNLGWTLRKPTSVTVDPSGLDLKSSTEYDPLTGNVIKSTSPAGNTEHPRPTYVSAFGSTGSGNGQFNAPFGEALDATGNIWVVDTADRRVEKFSPSGTFIAAYGTAGTSESAVQFEEPFGIAINQSTGNVYVADAHNNRVLEMSSSGAFVRVFGTAGTGNGQFNEAEGIAIDPSGNVYVTDYGNNRVQEFSSTGSYLAQFGTAGSGNGQFSGPDAITIAGGNIYVADNNHGRVEVFNESHAFLRTIGTSGTGNGQLRFPGGVAVDSAGHVYVSDTGNDRIEMFDETGHYLMQFGQPGTGNGQLEEPRGIVLGSESNILVVDGLNNRVENWYYNTAPHTTRSIYYSVAANSEFAECGGKPEWANLPCKTVPLVQPKSGPKLPETLVTYNEWDEPLTITETFGSVTRIKHDGYDSAERPTSSVTTSSVGGTIPATLNKYSSTTGLLETQENAEETQRVKNIVNSLGETTEYTDADGNTTVNEYDRDGRVTHVTDVKGSTTHTWNQIYNYGETGALSSVVDSVAGTFAVATRDVEGNIVSETYPNGMTATYVRNPAGQETGLEYKKTTHCTEPAQHCQLFADTIVPSIHGETVKQVSTLAEQPLLTYDAAGRLTSVEEKPTGEGCSTREYSYDEEGNRLSLATHPAGTGGACTNTGGTIAYHNYDAADRLNDAGITYSELGNTVTLPAADAGGHTLTSTYYSDGQVEIQTQNEETHTYSLDPAGRIRKAVTAGATAISHYGGPGTTPAWTSEGSEKWTRSIAGADGALAAVEENGTASLQLPDLQGNIVGNASLSETQITLVSTYRSNEFGVPTTSSPPKYSWLGAGGVTSELPATGIITEDTTSYVPQTGLPLQTQPVEPAVPVNDPTPFSNPIPPWVAQGMASLAAQQFATAEQARHTLEESNQPAGLVPRPPLEVETSGNGGCIGTMACASRNTGVNCRAAVQFGEPWSATLLAGAAIRCIFKVPRVELEVCILAQAERGGYRNIICSKARFTDSHGGHTQAEEGCGIGIKYISWVWGRVWGSVLYNEELIPRETGTWKCTGEGGVDVAVSIFENAIPDA